MGEVWRAKDTRLDREVAVKVLLPGFADDENHQPLVLVGLAHIEAQLLAQRGWE